MITNKQILFLQNCKQYKRGMLLENYVPTVNGILDEQGNFIKKENFIYLTEKLSRDDEEQVRKLVKEMLRLVLWRLYTRASFITQ
jgi:hypothetical protein